MDLRFYFQLLVRRLPHFMIFLLVGTAVGVSVAAMMPPVYSTQAILVVESEQIPGELAASTVQTEATESLQIIRQRILTRERLFALAEEYDIYGEDEERLQGMTGDDIVDDLRRRIDIRTTGGERRGQTEATIVTVGFSAPSGELAADVVNEVVRQILEENLALRRGAAGQTLEFFVSEVDRLDRALKEREEQLLVFQEENLDALPDSLDFRRARQSALQERLQQLQREESVLRDRRNRIVTLFETTGEVIAVEDRPLSENEKLLARTREELFIARSLLAAGNPRIRILEARIATMSRLVAEEQAARIGQSSPGDDNRVSPYEIQLADIDGQLEFIAEQKSQLAEQMAVLAASIEETPANAIRLGSMQRDYNAVQQQYEQAVENRARAEMGDVIENLSKGQRITVIEPAVAPVEPENRNRRLIAAGGFGAGAGLGAGFVLLLELLNSAVRRPAELERRLGIVPFGTLPVMRSRGQILRRRAAAALIVVLIVAGVPAAVSHFQTEVMSFELALQDLLGRTGLDQFALPL